MTLDESSRPLKVFISSTYEDLRRYIEIAEEVLRDEKFGFDQFKHWEATGRPSVPECRERVGACDALIVLVGGTYGWVPPAEDGGDGRSSITRLEVVWALEKPMPVLPFFVTEPVDGERPATPAQDMRLAEFLAELQKKLGKSVSSPEMFREALRYSLVLLDRNYHRAPQTIPREVGDSAQGRYQDFRDREQARSVLFEALSGTQFRAAAIVGKGGFGKSALANYTIDQMRQHEQLDTVIYLNSARHAPIEAYDVFMSTMAASGQARRAARARGGRGGSWADLWAIESPRATPN